MQYCKLSVMISLYCSLLNTSIHPTTENVTKCGMVLLPTLYFEDIGQLLYKIGTLCFQKSPMQSGQKLAASSDPLRWNTCASECYKMWNGIVTNFVFWRHRLTFVQDRNFVFSKSPMQSGQEFAASSVPLRWNTCAREVSFSGITKNIQHPFFPAFIWIFSNCFDDLFAGELLNITNEFFKLCSFTTDD